MTERRIVRARAPLSPGRRWALRGLILAAVILSPYLVTARQPAPALGATLAGLKQCPQSPSCVSSDFPYILGSNAARIFHQKLPPRPSHFVDPIELESGADEGWKVLVETVRRQPGVKIVESTDQYLRAERSTTIYGLIDDFELARLYSGTVLIRSAARLGYSDFGRNRRFVEQVRVEFERDRPQTVGEF